MAPIQTNRSPFPTLPTPNKELYRRSREKSANKKIKNRPINDYAVGEKGVDSRKKTCARFGRKYINLNNLTQTFSLPCASASLPAHAARMRRKIETEMTEKERRLGAFHWIEFEDVNNEGTVSRETEQRKGFHYRWRFFSMIDRENCLCVFHAIF